jgi:predicted dehydrogenase
VIAECDCIVVLSPDNVERHEDLADLPLRSGKPVYVDKPFAPSLAAGRRMFEKAEKHGTPLMSSSALRFGSALEKAITETVAGQRVNFAATRGGGVFETYAIHQIEMLVAMLGPGASRVMQCGTESAKLMVVDYPDGRGGAMNLIWNHPFQMSTDYGDKGLVVIDSMDDFFPRFIEAMLSFFDSGESPIPKEQTLEITALIEAGTAALAQPDSWVAVPK